jgi:hypothetical protein
MTKQERYMKSLKDKGLTKACFMIPIDALEEMKARATKLREEHLKGRKKND